MSVRWRPLLSAHFPKRYLSVLHHSLQHVGRNCCQFLPEVLLQIHRCPCFIFVHIALEISSEEEVLRLGTFVQMNIEVPAKYPLSYDKIVVFEIRLHSKSPMLYRPALHGNWNALSLARRALKEKIPHAKDSTHNCFAKSSGISAGPCIYKCMVNNMNFFFNLCARKSNLNISFGLWTEIPQTCTLKCKCLTKCFKSSRM